MPKKVIIIISVIIGIIVLGVGVYILEDLIDRDNYSNYSENQNNNSSGLTLEEAENIALQRYPGASIVAAELIDRDNTKVWDIELDNDFAVYINSVSGEIVEIENRNPSQTSDNENTTNNDSNTQTNTDSNQNTNSETNNTGSQISLSRARDIAIEIYPGTSVLNSEIVTREDGIRAWDIELSNGMAVYIDVNSGEIIEVERN